MSEGVWIILESWEDERAHAIGLAVHYANTGKHDRASYDKARLQPDNDRASIDAARAEIAVAKAYGGYWHGGHWAAADHAKHSERHADITVRRMVDGRPISQGIEVKRRRTGTMVPVDQKDADRNHLIVWAETHGCDADHYAPRVRIIGQALAAQVWADAEPWGDDQHRRKFSPALLSPPSVLEEYL